MRSRTDEQEYVRLTERQREWLALYDKQLGYVSSRKEVLSFVYHNLIRMGMPEGE